jgi:hypothetical protein
VIQYSTSFSPFSEISFSNCVTILSRRAIDLNQWIYLSRDYHSKFQRKGHGGIASSLLQVKSLSPNHRLLIALRSPDGVVETGLCMGPPEKNAPSPACGAQQDTFSGPVSWRKSQNCGDFP